MKTLLRYRCDMSRCVVIQKPSVDWPVVIADIEEAGLTQKQIAKRAGCSQPHISDLKRRDQLDTRFTVGAKLLLLREEQLARVR